MDIDYKALAERAGADRTEYKVVTGVKFKTIANADLAEGEFLAYAAVYNNQDSYGDVIRKGAFAESLAGYVAKGKKIPLYFGHNLSDPDMNLGWILSAEEDDFGLLVHGKFDLEDEKSARTYRKVKGGRFDQLSFGYRVLEGAVVESPEFKNGWYYELRKLHIHEVSIVPIGANDQTHFVAVKSGDNVEVKAGKTISAANEKKINDAIAAAEAMVASLKEVLATVAPSSSDEEAEKSAGHQTTTASTSEPEKDEEPVQAKSSNPMRDVSAYMSAQLELLALADNN